MIAKVFKLIFKILFDFTSNHEQKLKKLFVIASNHKEFFKFSLRFRIINEQNKSDYKQLL